MTTSKITPQQAIDILRRKYQTKQITLSQLMNATMEIAKCNEKFFNQCAELHKQGKLVEFVTGSGDIQSDLSDAYDDWKTLAKATTAKLIKDVQDGKITSAQAQAEMKKIQAQGDEAWDSLAWYQQGLHVTDPLTDFFGARWSEVKNATKKVGSFTGGVINKGADTVGKVITDVSGGVKSVGEGAGSLLKAGGFIIPVVIGIAAFAAYKIIASDTGKAVAGAAARRLT